MAERQLGVSRLAVRRLGDSSGAPTTAKYIIQTANSSLPQAQVLGSLATGILKNTTTTGVLTIAAAGTDYIKGTGIAGGQAIYGGTASGEELHLYSTVHATKGKIYFGDNTVYDEVNSRLGINTASPEAPLQVEGGSIIASGGIITTTIEPSGWFHELLLKATISNYGVVAVLETGTFFSVETSTRNQLFKAEPTGVITFGTDTFDHTVGQIYSFYGATTLASATNPDWDAVMFWPATLTLTGDTPITATVRYINVGQPKITSASAITVDKAVTMLIEGSPLADGSTTITDSVALKVDGNAEFGTNSPLRVYANDVSIRGAPSTAGIALNVWADDTLASGAAVTWQGITFGFSVLSLTGTTTVDHIRFFQIEAPQIADVDAIDVTTASTVYVQGPPTATGSAVIVNPWAIYVAAGSSMFYLNATDGDPIVTEVQDGVGGILLRSNATDSMRIVATNTTDVGNVLCDDLKFKNFAGSTEYAHLSSAGFTAFGNIDVSSTGVGFNGTSAVAKPEITGSKGANAALGSLLTALASQGLVLDSTT